MDTTNGRIYDSKLDAMRHGVSRKRVMEIDSAGRYRNRKVGRNDICPCGSGLKFKKCHWGKEIPRN